MGLAVQFCFAGGDLVKIKQRVMLWLLASVFCTVLTYVAIHRYLDQQSQLWQQQHAEPTGAYLVFNHDLPEGKAITAEDLSLRSFPIRIAQANWLVEDDLMQVIGSLLRIPVARGAPISMAYLKRDSTSMLRATLATGERAVTTRVTHEQVLAGLLEPGDIVDIVGASEMSGDHTGSHRLTNVEVLAMDKSMAGDNSSHDFVETLTLRLTVAEAQRFEQLRQLPFSVWLHPAEAEPGIPVLLHPALPRLHRMGVE